MPDIRIKDLTTTASTTAADDFFAADGATNGTRKLSAYSPTFGGNATVGGTLTVSGTGDSAVSGNLTIPADKGFYLKQGNVAKWTSDGSSTGTSRGDIYCDSGGAMFVRTGGTSTAISISSSQVVSVVGTLASTSTSSGALVVGNGTSGGLGVGGAANVGGVVKGAQNTHSDASVPTGLSAGFQVDVQAATTRDILTFGDSSRHGLIRGYQDGSGRVQWAFGRYTASTFAEYVRITGVAATDAVLSIYGTTASTDTSSGALVVSGGLGVAKSINAGAGGSTHIFTGGDGGSGSTIFALKDTAGTTRVNVDGVGTVGIGVNLVLSGSSNVFRITNAQTPANATATGTAGTICWDTSYIYVCTATNTWKRAAISTW